MRADDSAAVLAINNAAVPAMNSLDESTLAWLVERAAYARVVVDDTAVAGFLIGLPPGTGYDSDNYRWFTAQYPAFLYIDRIAVAERARGCGLGSALYDDIASFARGRWPCLVSEVNLEPPNPRSATFHARHGFAAVGELRRSHPGAHATRVTMFRRPLD